MRKSMRAPVAASHLEHRGYRRSGVAAAAVLDETPKFVREKLKRAEEPAGANAIGASDGALR